jgi:tetratricopeptide (TPR) repeat protein
VHIKMANKDLATDEFINALEAKPDHQGALDALTQLGVLCKIYENPKDATSLIYVRADSVADYLTGEWDKEARSVDFFLEQIAYNDRERRYGVVLEAADRALKAAGAAGNEVASLSKISAYRALERLDEALAAAKDYVAKNPGSVGGLVELARCFGSTGDTAQAEASVDQALVLDPGDLGAMMLKFWPDDPNDVQKVGDMLPSLTAFVEAHGDIPGTWRTLARAYLVLSRIDDALALFKKAVDLKPADDDLRSEWWAELAKHEHPEEIIKDAEKLGDLKARDWRLRWNEAEAYSGLGKMVEARACFSALNYDEALHVDIRRRAKRAVNSLAEKMQGGG